MKIAEALVLRKHLEAKVDQLKPLYIQGEKGMFEVRTERKSVGENVDEITTQVPRITMAEVTKEYNLYSKSLRELDTAIQRANWECDLANFTLDKSVAV